MSGEFYTIAEVRRLLALAQRLGFRDDVAHWKSELARLERTQSHANGSEQEHGA